MRIKTSNLLVLSGLALFALAMLSSTLRVRREVVKLDRSDPFRNFQKVDLPPFQRLILRTGRADTTMKSFQMRYWWFKTLIMPAGQPRLMLLNRVRDSLHWEVKDGTLIISGFDTKSSLNSNTAALVLQTPGLQQADIQGSYAVFEGFRADSLQLRLAPASEAELTQCRIGYLDLRVEDRSTATINEGTTIASLHAGLLRRATLRCDDILPGRFTHSVSPESEVSVKGKAMALFLRTE